MTRLTETPHMDAVLKSLTPGEIGIIASVLDQDHGDDDMVDALTTAIIDEEVGTDSAFLYIPNNYPPALADLQERLAYHIVHVLDRKLPVPDPDSSATLCDELQAYCKTESLPQYSADELICEELTDAQRAYISDFITRWEAIATAERDPENVAIMQSRDDTARAIVENEFENWSHKELVDNIIDRMSLKEIEEFASETVELLEEDNG